MKGGRPASDACQLGTGWMFDYIEGKLVSASPTQAVIATGGIGYRLTIPVSTFDALPKDGECKVHTYLHVREDVLRLYGFVTEDERRIFSSLLSVQGVGPGTAIAILNGIPVDEFRHAVANDDLNVLSRAKGIGRKTAQRIVLELRREMERQLVELPTTGTSGAATSSDAVAAMLALGYKRSAAETAVSRAAKALGQGASLEKIIREALQQV